MAIEIVFARSIRKPSIPTFSLKFNNTSYTKVDSYTGVSQRISDSTVDIIIKNQPFTTIYNAETHANTSLYYNVQVKGHYTKSWTDVLGSTNYTDSWTDEVYTWYNYQVQSNSDYTVISLPALYSIGSKVDFCVQAVIANETRVVLHDSPPLEWPFSQFSQFPPEIEYTYATVMLVIETSDWSTVHTLNIEEDAVTVTTAPNTSPPPSPTKYTPPPTPSPTTTPTATPTPTPSTEPTSPPTSTSSQEPLLTSIQTEIILGATILVVVLGAAKVADYRSNKRSKSSEKTAKL